MKNINYNHNRAIDEYTYNASLHQYARIRTVNATCLTCSNSVKVESISEVALISEILSGDQLAVSPFLIGCLGDCFDASFADTCVVSAASSGNFSKYSSKSYPKGGWILQCTFPTKPQSKPQSPHRHMCINLMLIPPLLPPPPPPFPP